MSKPTQFQGWSEGMDVPYGPYRAVVERVVDGGMLSNFPVWLFDAKEPQWPIFGLKLVQRPEVPIGEQLPQPVPRGGVSQVIHYLRSLVDTMMAAHGRLYIEDRQFDLSAEHAMALYESGRDAAEEFLADQRDREGLRQA